MESMVDQLAASNKQPATPVTPVTQSVTAPAASGSAGSSLDSMVDQLANQNKPATQTPQTPVGSDDQGFLSGAWSMTGAPLVSLGKQFYNYYKQKAESEQNKPLGTQSLDAVVTGMAGPLAMVKDAVADENHPLRQIANDIYQAHKDQAFKSAVSLQHTLDAIKRGDIEEAKRSALEYAGHTGATALPILGPAAATAGEDIGAGRTGQGLGEATGLIGSIVAPEAIKGGASKVLGKLRPTEANLAGESIPVRASQESKIANAAEIVAPTKPLEKFDIEKTQPAAKRAIGNVASGAESQPIGKMATTPEESVSPAKDFGDRAEQIRAQSKPVFTKLDDLTKNDDMQFSDLQKQERAAYRTGDIEKAKQAAAKQQAVLTKYADQFDPKDLQNARANWRQAAALDDVHDALTTKGVVGPTPVEFRVKGAPDPGYINGKAFSKQILALRDSGALKDAGLTPEHIQSLQDLSTLLEKSANVHKFGQLAKLTEWGGAGITAVLHPAAAVAGAKAVVPAYLVQQALGRILTTPEAATSAVNLLKAAPVAVAAREVQK